jgi:hypothetical protein
MRKSAFIALLAALALFPFDLPAAKLTLRDGTVIFGEFVTGTPRVITLRDRNGMERRFNVSQIATLDFNGYRGDEFGRGTAYREQNGPSGNPSGNPIVLPAGAAVPVRTSEPIASERGAVGRTYAAVVQEDVVDADGRVVIPRGAEALLTIRAVGSGENASTGENRVLDLNSVLMDGRRYDLDSVSPRGSTGLGPNRRAGEVAGGGAIVASVVGAVVGAGRGSAGAAAEPGMQVLTRGYEIRVPADTELNFRITQPVYLDERR